MADEIYTVGEGYDDDEIMDAINLMPGDLTAAGHQWAQVYYCDADDHSVAYAETLDIYTGFSNGSAADYIDVGAMVSHGGMRDSGIIIDVSSSAVSVRINTTQYVKFHDFCITGPGAYKDGTEYIFFGHLAIKIFNNLFYNLAVKASASNRIIYVQNKNVKIYNNMFFNNFGTDWFLAISCNYAATSGDEIEIINNVIFSL
jgi:hypothetical protein